MRYNAKNKLSYRPKINTISSGTRGQDLEMKISMKIYLTIEVMLFYFKFSLFNTKEKITFPLKKIR